MTTSMIITGRIMIIYWCKMISMPNSRKRPFIQLILILNLRCSIIRSRWRGSRAIPRQRLTRFCTTRDMPIWWTSGAIGQRSGGALEVQFQPNSREPFKERIYSFKIDIWEGLQHLISHRGIYHKIITEMRWLRPWLGKQVRIVAHNCFHQYQKVLLNIKNNYRISSDEKNYQL